MIARAVLLAGLLLASPAVAGKNLFALPVGPGGPGVGPWAIAIWPYEGCSGCEQSEDDTKGFAAARDAIISGDFSGVDMSATAIHILPERPISSTDRSATPAELHQLVAGCEVGSEGILERYPISGPGVSFGVGLDCPGDEERKWMSLNFVDGRLAHVYFLPGEPVWVWSED